MKPIRSVIRRVLDQRLEGLDVQVGPRPACGWIRAIRDALGMSTFELGERMGLTATRVSQLERAEADGSIRLSALERSAASLNCKVCYVLVPNESLQQMVRRQALEKAAKVVAESTSHAGVSIPVEDRPLLEAAISEQVEARAYELIDRRGLWRISAPVTRGEHDDSSP
jgi:predicted DNA-binding mobile mystery protein A